MAGESAGSDASRNTTTTSLPAAAPATDSVTLYGPANEDLMTIRSIDREGDNLVVKGHAYGTMPLSITIRPSQARRLFKLLKLSVLPFLLGFAFRGSRHRD